MRIAMIAMSGVRAVDPELLAVGLTLPGIVARSQVIAALPSLGLLTLAGMTPARHTVDYREADTPEDVDALPLDYDLAAISTLSPQLPEAFRVAARFRAAGVPTVMGGLTASMLPGTVLEHCDAVVVGQGEPVWPEVLADAEAGRMQGVYGSLGTTFDLGEAPMPAFEQLAGRHYDRIPVQTSRGCPYRCEFCGSSVLYTPRYLHKPVAKVLAEVDRVRELFPKPFIEFADDNTFANKAYGRDLMDGLRTRGVPWFAETDLSVAYDEDLLRRMAGAGCRQVLIGFESPVQDGMDGVEQKANWKLRQVPRYREAVRAIQSHGIGVIGCFVLGLDGQGPEAFADVGEFVRTSGLYEVQVTLQTPFAGTPLHRRLAAEGRLDDPPDWGRMTLFDLTYEPRGMSREALRTGFRGLVQELYSAGAVADRRAAFARQREAGPRPRR